MTGFSQPLLRLFSTSVLMILVIGCISVSTDREITSAPLNTQANAQALSSGATMTDQIHLNTSTSQYTFAETLSRAQAAIDKRGFKTFAVIDHAAGAASIGETLRPTTLLIFGNPKGGTPVMQSAQTMGIALPLKLLVYENANGQTLVAWENMAQIFERHGVTDRAPVLTKIEGALAAITTEATGTSN